MVSPQTKQTIALLFAIAFVLASLLFVNYVIYFDWLNFYVCANKPNCNATARLRNQRPDSLKLASSFKIADVQGTRENCKFVVRDATPQEQYIISEARWKQMSESLQKTVESEWIQFSTINQLIPPMDLAHAFYEQFLNDILVKVDAQISSAHSVFREQSNGVEYCGQIFTRSNTSVFHSEACSCPLGKLRVAIGDNLYLCSSQEYHTSFVKTTLSQTTNMPTPTEDLYNAPFPRSLTRIRYNPSQAYALTPNLDGLVPI